MARDKLLCLLADLLCGRLGDLFGDRLGDLFGDLFIERLRWDLILIYLYII